MLAEFFGADGGKHSGRNTGCVFRGLGAGGWGVGGEAGKEEHCAWTPGWPCGWSGPAAFKGRASKGRRDRSAGDGLSGEVQCDLNWGARRTGPVQMLWPRPDPLDQEEEDGRDTQVECLQAWGAGVQRGDRY